MSTEPDWAGHSRVTSTKINPTVSRWTIVKNEHEFPVAHFFMPADAALFVAAADTETGYGAVLGLLREFLDLPLTEYDTMRRFFKCRACGRPISESSEDQCKRPDCCWVRARAIIEKTGGGTNE